MTELEKLIDAFQKLSFEDKKKKLVLMLEGLKGTNEVFVKVLDATKNNPRVDEEFLVGCYSDIMEYAVFLTEHEKEKKIKQLSENLHSKMQRLHDIEAAERAKENPDDLLKGL